MKRRIRPRTRFLLPSTLALALLLGLLPSSSRAREAPKRLGLDATQIPIWTLDLGALGYPLIPGRQIVLANGNIRPRIAPISFTEDGKILVTFVTPPQLRGEKGQAPAYRLHVLIVDGMTGHVEATKDWPVPSARQSSVMPVRNGRIAVSVQDKVMLYSTNLELVKELDLQLTSESARGQWDIVRSPQGKNLQFEYGLKLADGRQPTLSYWEQRYVLVDTENLEVVHTWTERSPHHTLIHIISDDRMGLSITGEYGRLEGPLVSLCTGRNEYCHGHNLFLDNQNVVSLAWTTEREKFMHFLSTRGGRLFTQMYPEGDCFAHAISADGRRVALAVYKDEGGVTVLDISPHHVLQRIWVYDIPSRKWVYTLETKKQKIKFDPDREELALSADGSLLGLVTKVGVLQVYRIP